MNSTCIEIEGIEVLLRKSLKAKRCNITVKPFEGVRVSVPQRLSFAKAQEFAQQHSGWIKKNIEKMQKHEEVFTIFDEKTIFKTRRHELLLKQLMVKNITATIKNNEIIVKYPLTVNVLDSEVQKIIRKGIVRAWRAEAKDYLIKRVDELAKEHFFEYKNITIKDLKSRWGSCSQDNNINLNLHLMRLSDEFVDYVILHELVHTIEKNHGRKFWTLFKEVFPDAIELDKKLKNFKIQIY